MTISIDKTKIEKANWRGGQQVITATLTSDDHGDLGTLKDLQFIGFGPKVEKEGKMVSPKMTDVVKQTTFGQAVSFQITHDAMFSDAIPNQCWMLVFIGDTCIYDYSFPRPIRFTSSNPFVSLSPAVIQLSQGGRFELTATLQEPTLNWNPSTDPDMPNGAFTIYYEEVGNESAKGESDESIGRALFSLEVSGSLTEWENPLIHQARTITVKNNLPAVDVEISITNDKSGYVDTFIIAKESFSLDRYPSISFDRVLSIGDTGNLFSPTTFTLTAAAHGGASCTAMCQRYPQYKLNFSGNSASYEFPDQCFFGQYMQLGQYPVYGDQPGGGVYHLIRCSPPEQAPSEGGDIRAESWIVAFYNSPTDYFGSMKHDSLSTPVGDYVYDSSIRVYMPPHTPDENEGVWTISGIHVSDLGLWPNDDVINLMSMLYP